MLDKTEVNVALVCANSIMREGLSRILGEEEFVVERSYKNCEAMLAGADGPVEASELIVIDVSAAQDVKTEVMALHKAFPKSRLVLLTDEFEYEIMVDSFRAGVDGYIVKEIACRSLVESLRLVTLGEKVLPSALLEHLSDRSVMPGRSGQSGAELVKLLSEREIETLRCLIMGYPNKVIAHRLDISEATVKVHVKAILRKLMVQNRTQAAIWAVNNGVDANATCATVAVEPQAIEASDELMALTQSA